LEGREGKGRRKEASSVSRKWRNEKKHTRGTAEQQEVVVVVGERAPGEDWRR